MPSFFQKAGRFKRQRLWSLTERSRKDQQISLSEIKKLYIKANLQMLPFENSKQAASKRIASLNIIIYAVNFGLITFNRELIFSGFVRS